MLLTIWTKTEVNQIYKAELHLGKGGGGSRSPYKFQQYISVSTAVNATHVTELV